MLSRWDTLWRISPNATLTNKHFYCWGLPTPKLGNSLYREYTAKVPQAQGGESRQGYINFKLVFPPMNGQQIFILRYIIATAAGGPIYLTIDRANGQGVDSDFIDVSGYPSMPNFDYGPGSAGKFFPGVELTVNNITIVADPSAIL
jgi:hypothetical protein